MHARMQYDVHLSDLYSTDKLVIYSAKLNKLADFEDGASYWKAKYVVICLIINEEKNITSMNRERDINEKIIFIWLWKKM